MDLDHGQGELENPDKGSTRSELLHRKAYASFPHTDAAEPCPATARDYTSCDRESTNARETGMSIFSCPIASTNDPTV